MKKLDWLVVSGMCALVLVAIFGLVLTRNFISPAAQTQPRQVLLVDEQPVETARSIMVLASSPEEQHFAQTSIALGRTCG